MLSLAVFGAGCVSFPQRYVSSRPYPTPSPEAFLQKWLERKTEFLTPVFALARIEVPGQRAIPVRLFLRRPGHLRVEAPHHPALMDPKLFFATNGRSFWLDSVVDGPQGAKQWTGLADACTFGEALAPQGLAFSFSADDLVELLLGHAPLLANHDPAQTELHWIPGPEGHEEVRIRNDRYEQRLELSSGSSPVLQLHQVALYDRKTGQMLWRVRNEKFSSVVVHAPKTNILLPRMPMKTSFTDKRTGVAMTITWQLWDADYQAAQRKYLEDGEPLFGLTERSDAPFQKITCGAIHGWAPVSP